MIVGQRGWRHRLVVLAFLAPSLVPLLAFMVVPMVSSIGLSFLTWNLISRARWVGLSNHRTLLHDGNFHAALGHTLYFIAGYLPITFLGGLGIALALNQKLKAIAGFERSTSCRS